MVVESQDEVVVSVAVIFVVIVVVVAMGVVVVIVVVVTVVVVVFVIVMVSVDDLSRRDGNEDVQDVLLMVEEDDAMGVAVAIALDALVLVADDEDDSAVVAVEVGISDVDADVEAVVVEIDDDIIIIIRALSWMSGVVGTTAPTSPTAMWLTRSLAAEGKIAPTNSKSRSANDVQTIRHPAFDPLLFPLAAISLWFCM